jgi:hypothetical protein
MDSLKHELDSWTDITDKSGFEKNGVEVIELGTEP